MSIYKEYFSCKDIVLISFIFSCALMISCAPKPYKGTVINSQFESKNPQPDYNDLNYWAASPFKYDPSDNSPKEFAATKKDSLADVFFVYPTSYTNSKMPDGWNADIK